MTATSQNPQFTPTKPAWAKAIAQPAQEFPLTQLPILSGSIPDALRGTLYRNGPARLERGGEKVGHWFDGDGAILAIHITDDGATGTYRYVRTAGFIAEEAENKFLYAGYGMTPPGLIWERWGKSAKNTANTSVMALPDKLLALWEGGNPHALDRHSLQTFGRDDLEGALDGDRAFSAHPKRDPATGEFYNFGLTPGLNTTLNLYRGDATGKIFQTSTIQLDGLPLVHDFVMAGRYLVFCVPPVQINLLPVAIGIQSFSDSMQWEPDRGTEILVVDRETLGVVSRETVDPWYQWHFANGFVDRDGSIVVDVVRYADFKTNQYLKEVATGETHTPAKATLWRLRIDPQSGHLNAHDEVINRSCEFPEIKPHQLGQASNSLYLSVHSAGAEIAKDVLGAIAHVDLSTGELTEADPGENRYPSEPIYASHPDNPDQGWILTVVFDGTTESSEVWIYDADGLDRAPICRLGLPSIIPLSFHGTWAPQR